MFYRSIQLYSLHPTILTILLSISALALAAALFSSNWNEQFDDILGNGYPLKWSIGDVGTVRMFVENTRHYQLDTVEGIQEWAQLVPPDGGVIHIDGHAGLFTISMFHQLRCLDVLRAAVVQANRTGALPDTVARHCLNYIRQMILCRSDLRLENVRDPVGPHAVDLTAMHTCQDWRKVYDAAERNIHASPPPS